MEINSSPLFASLEQDPSLLDNKEGTQRPRADENQDNNSILRQTIKPRNGDDKRRKITS
jgi:hypothetical protein